MQSDPTGIGGRRLPFTLIENIVLKDQALGPGKIRGPLCHLLAIRGYHSKSCSHVSVKSLRNHQAPGGSGLYDAQPGELLLALGPIQ